MPHPLGELLFESSRAPCADPSGFGSPPRAPKARRLA
jgi:hypothetical protein